MDFQTALRRTFKYKYKPDRANMPSVVVLRRRRKDGEYAGPAGLCDMMLRMECKVGVEIGTYLGESAERWCKTNPKLHLTCVDPYRVYSARRSQETQDECYQSALHRLEPYDAEIWRQSSMEAVGQFENESLDFVYIDGDHLFDAVMLDLIYWAPKVRKGGMVILHDYTVTQGPGVIKAVDAYTHCHCIRPWYATMDYTPSVFWEAGVELA